MLKRWIFCILLICLLFSIAGCGAQKEAAGNNIDGNYYLTEATHPMERQILHESIQQRFRQPALRRVLRSKLFYELLHHEAKRFRILEVWNLIEAEEEEFPEAAAVDVLALLHSKQHIPCADDGDMGSHRVVGNRPAVLAETQIRLAGLDTGRWPRISLVPQIC